MKERNTTLETTDHNNRNNSENIKETPDERIPGKLIGAIVAVGSLAPESGLGGGTGRPSSNVDSP